MHTRVLLVQHFHVHVSPPIDLLSQKTVLPQHKDQNPSSRTLTTVYQLCREGQKGRQTRFGEQTLVMNLKQDLASTVPDGSTLSLKIREFSISAPVKENTAAFPLKALDAGISINGEVTAFPQSNASECLDINNSTGGASELKGCLSNDQPRKICFDCSQSFNGFMAFDRITHTVELSTTIPSSYWSSCHGGGICIFCRL